jgi:hypothetical protein
MQHSSIINGTKHGYILLISVVIIGAISSAILASLLLLGNSASILSLSIHQSAGAQAAAQACAEYALQKLRNDPTYAGNETRTFPDSTCDILSIGGIGNENRLLCTEGHQGDAVRRLQIIIERVLPAVRIGTFEEVPVFTLCT